MIKTRRKRYLLPVLCMLFLIGCGKKEVVTEEVTTESIISVGDYNTSGPTTYTKVTSVNQFSFDVRDRDLNGDFLVNPLSVLNTTTSPKYIHDSSYNYVSVLPSDNNILLNFKDEYLLYKPTECIYSLKTNIVNGMSLFYYTQDVAQQEIKNFLKPYGFTSLTFDANSTMFNLSEDNSRMDYFQKLEFKDKDVSFIGFVYIVENDDGQNFFLVGANKNHITLEELEVIANSFKGNSDPTELFMDESSTIMTLDIQGLALTGNFPNVLGINRGLENAFLYTSTDGFSENEPYYANPYSDCIVKYNVYTMPDTINIPYFLDIYPDSFAYTDSSPIYDQTQGEWYCFDKVCENGYYSNTSLFVSIQEGRCLVFQVWYNSDMIRNSMMNAISTFTVDLGASTQTAMPESMETLYNELHPVEDPLATNTDASLGISIDPSVEE